MKKTTIHERVYDYADGSMPPDERSLFERHLQTCRQCGEELQQLSAVMDGLSRLPRSIPPLRAEGERVVEAIQIGPGWHADVDDPIHRRERRLGLLQR